MFEKTDKELMYATDEEKEFFYKCIYGLPTMKGFKNDYTDKYNIPIPYGSSPHISRHLKAAIDIVKPKTILEIGFNMGYSSALFLELCDAYVLSCDVSDKDETMAASIILKRRYLDRFDFVFRSHLPILGQINFDMGFIDGAHDEENITIDIQLMKDYGIKYILFDDWYPRFGATQKAFIKYPLTIVKDMDNLILATWQD